jgi:hypothetical protein
MRQNMIKTQNEETCVCEACVHDYPLLQHSWGNLGNLVSSSSLADIKREYKKNCRTIADNPEKSSKLKIMKLIVRNWYLMSAIAKLEPFVFLN